MIPVENIENWGRRAKLIEEEYKIIIKIKNDLR